MQMKPQMNARQMRNRPQINADERRLKAIGRHGLRRVDKRRASTIFRLKGFNHEGHEGHEGKTRVIERLDNMKPLDNMKYLDINFLHATWVTAANRLSFVLFVPFVVNAFDLSSAFICVHPRSSAAKQGLLQYLT